MNTSHPLEVRAERIAHRAAVERLQEVYRQLAEFEPKTTLPRDKENDVNDSEKKQEVNK